MTDCKRLSGRTVVVTGGASGIGEAAVQRLLEEGAQVVVGDINLAALRRLEAHIQGGSCAGRLAVVLCDVSQESDIIRLLRHTIEKFGHLDCMINNAGTGGAFEPLIETSVADWDRTQAVNLRSVFLGTKHAARIMMRQGEGGSIINVASIAAMSGGAGGAAYSASKAGVVSLTQTAAVQLGAHNIRVNTIVPGILVSPLTHRNVDPEGLKNLAAGTLPLPIAGESKHLAPSFAFFASDDSRFISGTTLVVDGGAGAMGLNLYSGQNPFGNAIVERARLAGVRHFDDGARVEDPGMTSPQQFPAVAADDSRPASREVPKVVLITGVSRGLGRAMCQEFARRGHIVVGCARDPAAVANLQAEFGDAHSFAVLDVVDDDKVQQWASQTLAHLGAPNLLLNNAAILGPTQQTWRCTDRELNEILNVNVRGTANIIRHFGPAMMKQKGSVIVNFSSGWGRDAAPRVAPYCASKWAIEGLTKAMSMEVPPHMCVVSLHPGIVQTDTLDVAFGEAAARYPSPEEWAKVAVPYLLNITPDHNGAQLSVPGMSEMR